ncbi:unnamed protein product [Staurois parvus]|uniref:Uncharacterized protein n=1 Tax=Staurois parvus TaxID=386267 RepID=A0ABN9EST8_9NEOB|nr:unnamed protein product [Staurois parvus]
MGPCTASHAAARPVICHGPPYRLLMHAAARSRNLSWAPVPPPHAAARSRVCHGSLYGLPLLLSPSPHSAMCHFQVSSHCWWVPFCHRGCCMASHCCCLHRHTVAPHSGFGAP